MKANNNNSNAAGSITSPPLSQQQQQQQQQQQIFVVNNSSNKISYEIAPGSPSTATTSSNSKQGIKIFRNNINTQLVNGTNTKNLYNNNKSNNNNNNNKKKGTEGETDEETDIDLY